MFKLRALRSRGSRVAFTVSIIGLLSPLAMSTERGQAKKTCQVCWQVTINMTAGSGGASDPHYKFASNPNPPPSTIDGCQEGPVNPGNDSIGDLQVCVGDTVTWTLTTDSKDAHLIVLQPDGVLSGPDGQTATAVFDAEETQATQVATALEVCDYCKYYVVAYGKNKKHLYQDANLDPQIIVGGSNPAYVSAELRKERNRISKLKRSIKPNLRASISDIECILSGLLEELPK